MNDRMNVFTTEGNVDIYLSRLHLTWSAEERDKLLRLLVQEEARMGDDREHIERAERRVADGRERVIRQRQLVAERRPAEGEDNQHIQLLETLERTQQLLETHLQTMRIGQERRKL